MTESHSRLEAELGHRFRNPALLAQALTHSSHTHETLGRASGFDNEQLEFLGDAVLGFLVSARLVEAYPHLPEGRLSKLKAHLVSATHLLETARRLRLGDYLQLGRGEELSGGRGKRALLANAVEALIAAVYLDGGIEAARGFVDRFVIGDRFTEKGLQDDLLEDYKSALQELLGARKLPLPKYVVVQEQGPQHRKTFTIELRIGNDFAAQADGPTKKAAAQQAAQRALAHFRSGQGVAPAPLAGGKND